MSYNSSFAQSGFAKIDAQSRSVPDSMVTYQSITQYLTKDLKTETEKLRAIYVWVTHNIRYDIKLSGQFISTNSILEKKAGVCMHYSQIVDDMCKTLGIKSYIINGYTKNFKNEIAREPHAWNLVQIKDSFRFIDATWGAGTVDESGVFKQKFDSSYFMSPSSVFIKNHIPFDPIWQCLSSPITNTAFKNPSQFILIKNGPFNFKDSILTYEKQDTVAQLESSNNRISKMEVTNALIKEQIIHNKNRIIIISTNRYNHEYNLVVEEYNNGMQALRKYIFYQPRLFKTPGSSSQTAEQDSATVFFFISSVQMLKSAQEKLVHLYLNEYKNMSDLKHLEAIIKEELAIANKERLRLEKFLGRKLPFM